MKISIITVCYNSEKTIEETIQSVLQQDCPDIEYIVLDGKSIDKTLEIVNKYKSKISKIISERDNGMYFAINKGIKIASGEVVGLLHSDDLLASNKILSKIANEFILKKVDCVYGDLVYVNKNDAEKVFRYWQSKEYYDGIFKTGWMPPHPTFYVKKNIFEKYGYYRTDFKTAADYELMLRFLHKFKISVSYLNEVIVKMRVGGKSNMNLRNRIVANLDDRRAWKINGLKPGLWTLTIKPLSKLTQFFNFKKFL